jgi:hypothetical protein
MEKILFLCILIYLHVYENIEMGLGQIWESLSPIPFPPVTIHTKFLLSLIWYW